MSIQHPAFTRVLRLRLKDKHARALRERAYWVNQVWNYCNDLSIKVLRRELQTATGVVQGVSWRHCRRIQRGDGYGYGWLAAIKPLTSKEHRLPPPAKAEGYPATKSI